MENIKQKVGLRLREIRLSKNLSQEQLADLVDLDRTYISGIERGKRNISIVNLEKLATGLEVSLSEFLEGL